MGSLFRSEEMRLCQMFLQTEAAYACVSELGELGLVEFKDLNSNVNAFQRRYVNEVRRCEEMERMLRYMEKELLKDGMKIFDTGEAPSAPPPKEMVDLEVKFEKLDGELREVNTNQEALKQNFLELSELKEVLIKTQHYFALHGQDIQHLIEEEQSYGHEEAIVGTRTGGAQLGFLVGTVLREKVPVFERVMKFITHGTVFMRSEEIAQPLEDPTTGDLMHKCVFIVFYQGEQLRNKVMKVCEGMRCTLYPCGDSASERTEVLTGVRTRLADLENVLESTQSHKQRILENVQKELRAWSIKVEKIKAIFHTLNMFKGSQNNLIAECWCPVRALDDIREALTKGEKISGSTIPTVIQPMQTDETPPTYYNCNKFVKGFQAIVDSYGVSTYGEVNPAPYTCITFPFLFAVMFGDAGHGLIMFIFGAWMCIKEKSLSAMKNTNEIWNTFFGGRYIIMMMGLFSVYTGLIYNDAFSRSMNIFGTQWEPQISDKELKENEDIQLDANLYHINGTAYFLGVDPIWQSAKNKIMFLNSLKMKMSVILGVSHMLFGICLGVFNHVHFKVKRNIFIKFIPEMLFLGCLFGYLIGLVFYKWLAFDAETSKCAPPLLIHYINMFMIKYNDTSAPCIDRDPQAVFYEGQEAVQLTMLALAAVSVPVLFIAGPVIDIVLAKRRLRKEREEDASLLNNEVMPAIEVNLAYQNDESQPEQPQPVVNNAHQNDESQPEQPQPDLPTQVKSVNSDEEDTAEANGDATVKRQSVPASAGQAAEQKKIPYGEIWIENIIETIEFCLGCISHTASYLRLWALSLAHAQLSEVLWTMVMHMGFTIGGEYIGGAILFVIFFFWANLTVGILLLMEGLSAFLHTLRLHWVEFQSKFYHGSGYHFMPFSFKNIMAMQTLEEGL